MGVFSGKEINAFTRSAESSAQCSCGLCLLFRARPGGPCTCGFSWEDPDQLESASGANPVDVEGKMSTRKGARAVGGRECVDHRQDCPVRRTMKRNLWACEQV